MSRELIDQVVDLLEQGKVNAFQLSRIASAVQECGEQLALDEAYIEEQDDEEEENLDIDLVRNLKEGSWQPDDDYGPLVDLNGFE